MSSMVGQVSSANDHVLVLVDELGVWTVVPVTPEGPRTPEQARTDLQRMLDKLYPNIRFGLAVSLATGEVTCRVERMSS